MIGLLTAPGSYAIDALVASSDLPLAAVDIVGCGLSSYDCPYGLPRISAGHTVIVVSGWLRQLQRQGTDVIKQVLPVLRERFERIVGFDHSDPFLLCLSDAEMAWMDVVLKVNGVYRDQELNNFVVGAPTPDGRWQEKDEPRGETYQLVNLRKVVLSTPCFLGIMPELRALTRRFYQASAAHRLARRLGDWLLARGARPLATRHPPRYTAHFFVSLTHRQRLDAARRLQRSALAWQGGITHVPHDIAGFAGAGLTTLTPAQHTVLLTQVAGEGLLLPYLNRFHYYRRMADCKAVVSITGYGELCFRMAEAWANNRILVCQDIAHAQTLFPFAAGRNVVYCRPDLSDLIDILEDIECNFRNYVDIAHQGRQDWQQWSRALPNILRQGFAPLYG